MPLTVVDALGRLAGVKRTGRGWIAICPSHDDHDPSLEIWLGENDRPLFKCYSGCSVPAIRAAISGQPIGPTTFKPPTGDVAPCVDDATRSEWARRIWRESRPAAGTLVQTYLGSRGLTIAPPRSLRFHPNAKHSTGIYGPAMVAAVQAPDGRVIAIHRTYLRTDGSGKADVRPQKAMLGPVVSGAVRLAPVAPTLIIGEGIESTLSAMQATRLPGWAALSTSGMLRVELPAVVHGILIAADNDPPGRQAAREMAMRFSREGRSVRIAYPPLNSDFNDMLRQGISA